ncbi:MAG TPA: ABC transporter ATP-binding protein [Candidatus Dormibacteraeota bacterium]|nr:ABC transporter ATP-binding protein [Candidatus Dormibacteraeota bacterium]
MSTDPAVAIEAVTFGYGVDPVVHDVSFTVAQGEFVGIIGPNGSGKSTLLKLMSGYLQPWRGRVAIEGGAAERMSRAALGRLIAVVPQDTAVTLPFTVMEMVLLGRTPHGPGFGFEDERDLAAARRAMERTDTLQLAGRRVTELSGGERQRVILARALAQEPRILLLDEPAAFLDIRHEVEMYDLLHDLQRAGMTVVSVLHDLNIAALYCDRLVLLAGGQVVGVGTPAEVITYPTLTAVYGTEVYVTMNDVTGALNVLPLSREHRQRLRRQFGGG